MSYFCILSMKCTQTYLSLLSYSSSCSVTQLCLTLCDPMDCNIPGFPVLDYLLEFAQTNHGEGNGNPLQYSCLKNAVDRGTWWAAVHSVTQSRTQRSNLACMHALEKETATHSNILAWRIPGTGELGGLPSMGFHRVRRD